MIESEVSVSTNYEEFLANVAIIRPFLILLLVFYHSFLVVSGGWGFADTIPEIEAYWWLDKLSCAFMLETFVFVSGYVFGYQVRLKGNSRLHAKRLFSSKFKRLIIPSLVFSFLYIVLLLDISQPLLITIRQTIEGVAHLWFLPMLFWCFAGVWLIEKIHIGSRIVIPLLVLCSIVSFIPLPFQLGQTLYYLLFFYVGYILQKDCVRIDFLYSVRSVVILISAFAVLFPTLTILNRNFNTMIESGNYQLLTKGILYSLKNLIKLIYSSVGLMMVLSITGVLLKSKIVSVPQWVIKIGSLCMGTYIFQQFILMALYKNTELPQLVSPLLLPWIGFIIALGGSLLLSYLLRLTKAGRFLIG